MHSKKNFAILFLLVVVVVLGFSLYRAGLLIRELREHIPYLIVNETLPPFEFLSINEEKEESHAGEDSVPKLIYIFSRPCTRCDKNTIFLKKLYSILKGKVKFYGVVVADDSTAFNFAAKSKLPFPLFIPKDINAFVKSFRLSNNSSHLIIADNNKVQYVCIGTLTDVEVKHAIKLLRS